MPHAELGGVTGATHQTNTKKRDKRSHACMQPSMFSIGHSNRRRRRVLMRSRRNPVAAAGVYTIFGRHWLPVAHLFSLLLSTNRAHGTLVSDFLAEASSETCISCTIRLK